MPTPLQERAYELLVRISSAEIDCKSDHRLATIALRLFDAAVDINAAMEQAVSATDRAAFRIHLHKVNCGVRMLKLWLRLLDDLGRIDPEVGSPLHDAAEEVHCLVVSALRSSRPAESRKPMVAS